MEKDTVLTMRGIYKSFPGVKALSNVDFTLRKGEIHALMGENGAGKSTLIKVLTGVYSKDEGENFFWIYAKKVVLLHRFSQKGENINYFKALKN